MPYNVWYYNTALDRAEPYTYEEAVERLRRHRGFIAVDTETIALNGKKKVMELVYNEETEEDEVAKLEYDAKTCIGIGVAISPTEAFYFPLGRPGWKNVPQSDPAPLLALLSDDSITKVFFNSMFDLDRIEDTFGIDCSSNFDDVAIACQVQGLWNALDDNANRLLNTFHYVIDDVLPKGKTMLDVPFPTTRMKCVLDCMDTYKLALRMRLLEWREDFDFTWWDENEIREFDVTKRIRECYLVDKLCVPILRKMTKRGFAIDERQVNYWDKKLRSEIREYDSFFAPLGVNPQSNDQLGYYLATVRGHYIGLTESRKHMKVTEEVLLNLQDPVGYMALSRRKRQKLWSTYIKNFIGKDRAHSHFRLDLATGRLGSWGFNSQNFPPRMRSIFKPESGSWTWMDLHQAEMRVWAYQAQDEVMLDAFAQNKSPHDTTLQALFPGVSKKLPDGTTNPQYTDAKSYNFALLADASAAVLARTTKRPIDVCQEYKNKLYELYWKSKEHQDYMRQRHRPWHMPDWVEDDFGRRCHIPDTSVHVDATHQEKCRLNYPFQATVAGVVKRQMIALDALGFDMVCQVHDEILVNGDVEFPEWIQDLHPAIKMPFEVEHTPTSMCQNCGKAHPEPRWV